MRLGFRLICALLAGLLLAACTRTIAGAPTGASVDGSVPGAAATESSASNPSGTAATPSAPGGSSGSTPGGAFTLTAGARGTLPDPAAPQVAGIDLPPGELIYYWDGAQDAPRAWAAVDVETDTALSLWAALVDVFPETGLWPLLLDAAFVQDYTHPSDFPLLEDTSGPIDGGELLMELGTGYGTAEAAFEIEELAKPTSATPSIPAESDLSIVDAYGILLVPATRPSDAIRQLGFSAPTHDLYAESVAGIVENWENRFGAFPIALGWDSMTMWVSNPPSLPDHAVDVSKELAAFSPDTYAMEDVPLKSDSQYLPYWMFWWY